MSSKGSKHLSNKTYGLPIIHLPHDEKYTGFDYSGGIQEEAPSLGKPVLVMQTQQNDLRGLKQAQSS